MPFTERVAGAVPCPGGRVHVSCVFTTVIATLLHCELPILTNTAAGLAPKFVPVIVTGMLPVVGQLTVTAPTLVQPETDVIVGTAVVAYCTTLSVSGVVWPPKVVARTMPTVPLVPAGNVQVSCVFATVCTTLEQADDPTTTVVPEVPRLFPLTVRVVPPVTGQFTVLTPA